MESVRSRILATRVLAEVAVMAALSATLYLIRPGSLPFGGAITLGSMVPVMWLSLRRGISAGIITGIIFGILALFIDILLLGASMVIATPLQAVLEYPVAFGVIGFTGIMHRKTVRFALFGMTLSLLVRFIIHYFVGVFVWYYVYAFPIEWGRWLYPAVYNGSFLAVEGIISAILLTILIRRGTLDYRL